MRGNSVISDQRSISDQRINQRSEIRDHRPGQTHVKTVKSVIAGLNPNSQSNLCFTGMYFMCVISVEPREDDKYHKKCRSFLPFQQFIPVRPRRQVTLAEVFTNTQLLLQKLVIQPNKNLCGEYFIQELGTYRLLRESVLLQTTSSFLNGRSRFVIDVVS